MGMITCDNHGPYDSDEHTDGCPECWDEFENLRSNVEKLKEEYDRTHTLRFQTRKAILKDLLVRADAIWDSRDGEALDGILQEMRRELE